MYKSKLIEVFYSLSKAQLRGLSRFVASPFFNKREDVTALFELLYKTPLDNRVALRKEKAFKKVFGNTIEFDTDRLDYTMSFLLKAIEQFLILENKTNNPTQNTIALLQEYRQLGLSKHFQQTLKLAQKQQKKNPLRDFDYYQQSFEIEMEQYHFLAAQQRTTSKNLQEVSSKLDLTFLVQKLKDACQLLAHQAVYKQQYDFGLLETILPYIDSHPTLLSNHPSIALYYYYYQAVTKPTIERYFQQFKQVFLEAHQAFESTELRDIYTLALNYCVRKANLGQEHYLEELFSFYEAGLDLGILLENEQLNPFKFNNITKLALKLNKLDWTQNFIETYKKLVDIQHHNTYINNAYAMLYFAEGKYQKSLDKLQQVDYKELFITLDAKVLLTKVYYHLDELEVLEAHVSSFTVFLRRKEILAYHRDIYKNFIRMIQKIIHIAPFDKEGRQKLRKQIVSTQKVLEKAWLISCLED
jgi:hypothetical protein